jgi:FAD/FMN-containing dehydrogenase/Fe-S oxidoreductase
MSLVASLRAVIDGEVDDSTRRRAEYSSDASNYRVVPLAVAFPRTTDDLTAIVGWARETGTPLTMRGGGTSVAGNAVGPGVVVDTSRHLRRVLSLDPDERSARVQPGVVLADLQAAAAQFGLRFGPDPSTQGRATIGGMIGNNACGPRAVAYGRTSDSVVSLDVVDGAGRAFTAGWGTAAIPALRDVVRTHLAVLRTELGRFRRQGSGYALEHLLPESGEALARALVGSEGTLGVVTQAELRLVPREAEPALVVLGYPTMADAADAIFPVLDERPLALEGLDARLVDVVRRSRGPGRVPELPGGAGWLMVETGGETGAEAVARARTIVSAAGALDARIVPAGPEALALWRIREDGAGLAGRTPDGEPTWPGWEDAAVPPERLGRYLREFEALMADYGITGLPYGHFGDGCIHIRLNLPLHDHAGVPTARRFLEDAARLVAAHGGSLSGEHGDGRARGELLRLMYSPAAIDAFAAVKSVFDPEDILNPGVIVRPRPLDADLRRPAARPLHAANGMAFRSDGGDLTRAFHRCVGVGKCRADTTLTGGFMCPSFVATQDEKDSTRGRARVLQEAVNGTLVLGGLPAPEVTEVLELCLSCKACSSDCPAGVDMAMYKSEVLHRRYRRRLRPSSHYALGWLPRWLLLPQPAPALVNAALRSLTLRRVALAMAGIDTRRSVPKLARRSFLTLRHRRAAATDASTDPRAVLWVDSFSSGFDPDVAAAATTLLRAAGFDVTTPRRRVCCGLTWITTGQLGGARRRLRRLLDLLGPIAGQGIPIVGLEPSCVAVLRSDLLELLPDDPRTAAVAAHVVTLAELLAASTPRKEWRPDLSGVRVIAQPHCHQHAVMGFVAEQQLLVSCGAEVQVLTGCCGMAGNFGMERGHYEVSVAIAEHSLLPALRANPDAVFVADGFSCRTQAADLAEVQGVHVAQLLATALERRSLAAPLTASADRGDQR